VSDVSIRDLRNHGGEVVDRALRGEEITITRAGKAVAELRAVARQPLSADALLRRWQSVPSVDVAALRADIDETIDGAL
jgi:prevent-host-death family protein